MVWTNVCVLGYTLQAGAQIRSMRIWLGAPDKLEVFKGVG
jgi:hypothetical protein